MGLNGRKDELKDLESGWDVEAGDRESGLVDNEQGRNHSMTRMRPPSLTRYFQAGEKSGESVPPLSEADLEEFNEEILGVKTHPTIMAILEEVNAQSEERATIPDIEVIRRKYSGDSPSRPHLQAVREEDALRQQFSTQYKSVHPRASDDEIALKADDEVKKHFADRIKSLSGRERSIYMVEKYDRYKYAWWESNNPLIRLWGQLNCPSQLIEDEVLITDIAKVLGKRLKKREGSEEGEESIDFTFIYSNALTLKQMILTKFPEHQGLLEAVISKDSSNNL